MGKDVIVACDFPDRGSVLSFLDQFSGHGANRGCRNESFQA